MSHIKVFLVSPGTGSRAIRKMVPAILFLILTAFPALAGPQDGEINARDMFFSIKDLANKPPQRKVRTPPQPRPNPPGHNIKVIPNPLGLRYSLLLRRPFGDFAEVSPDTTFRTGDQIRLSVMSNQRGYLYIVQKGSSGAWNPLFPDPRIDGGNNQIDPEHRYEIPGGGGEAFRIEGQPGEEKIFILLTRAPENDLDALIALLRSGVGSPAGSNIQDTVVEQIRNHIRTRDLVFTKFDDRAGEKAVYIVNKTASGGEARVIADITLNHW
jgi:uncharacterized protein DUF4384